MQNIHTKKHVSKQEIAIIIAALYNYIHQKKSMQIKTKQTINNWKLQQWK
jgi:hypothetical protein